MEPGRATPAGEGVYTWEVELEDGHRSGGDVAGSGHEEDEGEGEGEENALDTGRKGGTPAMVAETHPRKNGKSFFASSWLSLQLNRANDHAVLL